MSNKSIENSIYRVYKKDLLKALEDKIERIKKHIEDFPESFDYCVRINTNVFMLDNKVTYTSYKAPTQKDIDMLLEPDIHIIYDSVNKCYMREVVFD